MQENKKVDQIENDIVLKIKNELKSTKQNIKENDIIQKTSGTNRLLWDAPIYIAVNINMEDDKTQNPNDFLEEQLKNQTKD
jgi:ABC-type phosphate transport system substrate-binding protein